MTGAESSQEAEQCIYVVRLPWEWVWVDDYEHAYQLATGEQSTEGGDDHPGEERIAIMGLSAREVECVYCDESVSESVIDRHHTDEHPMERWNPAYYSGEVNVW